MMNSTCILEHPNKEWADTLLQRSQFAQATPQEIYSRHYKVLLNFDSLSSDVLRIPAISHHVWLTNPLKPREVRDSDIENLKNTLEVIDIHAQTPWEHIFWTNCKTCIPETIGKLASLNIQVKWLGEIAEQLVSYDTVRSLIYDNKFGMAADIIRYDLVKRMGGFYSDLNYHVHTSPENLMHKVDFFVDSVSSEISFAVENYMLAANPNHPIIVHALDHSLHEVLHSPLWADKDCDADSLTNKFTYETFCEAYALHANRYDRIDIAIPHREDDEEEGQTQDYTSKTIGHHSDGTTTVTYTFPTCSLNPSEYFDYHEYILSQIKPLLPQETQCPALDIAIGKDGTDGHTWGESHHTNSMESYV